MRLFDPEEMPAQWPRLTAHAVGIALAAWAIGSFALQPGDYTAQRALMLRGGGISMTFLIAAFACTPVSRFLGLHTIMLARRALGLYGFGFALLHVLAYAWLDNDFALPLMLRDLGERRAMGVGLIALMLLVPLAITSTNGWQRTLGRRWRRLHTLVYAAIALAVLHFLLLDRDVLVWAWICAAIIALLGAVRLIPRKSARS